MSTLYPRKTFQLSPLTPETITEEIDNDSYPKRALRANLIYQAAAANPNVPMYKPADTGVLLRHSMYALEIFQRGLGIRGVVEEGISETETLSLRNTWKSIPAWTEGQVEDLCLKWENLGFEKRQKLIGFWWRAETARAGALGLEKSFFDPRLRSRHEQKIVEAVTERILESMPLFLDDGNYNEEYLTSVVVLACRESMIHEQLRKRMAILAQGYNQIRSYTVPTHKTY